MVSSFTNTERSRRATFAAEGESDDAPKGLGRDANKPLMRKRCADDVRSPIGMVPRTISAGRNAWLALVHFGELLVAWLVPQQRRPAETSGFDSNSSRPLSAFLPGRFKGFPRGARSVRGDFVGLLLASRQLRRLR